MEHKRVRVTREMPFCKVGEEFELKEVESYKLGVGKTDYLAFEINPTAFSSVFRKCIKIKDMVKDGWLEWVEPKCKICGDTGKIPHNTFDSEEYLVATFKPCSCQEEKSLEGKLCYLRFPCEPDHSFAVVEEDAHRIAQLATTHFKEKFDKGFHYEGCCCDDCDTIRTALFGKTNT